MLKSAIVTGATGFLGYALIKELLKNNVYVYALCRKNSKRLSRLTGVNNVELLEIDLNNIELNKEINGIDIFYHLAWEGERYDFKSQSANISRSLNCINLASRLGCKRFICTGSQAEYGNTNEPIIEETSLKPTTAYGSCKVVTYYLTMSLAKQLGIEHTWVRIFSVFGPNDSPSTLIMTLIKELSETGYATMDTDGNHIWNYLYEDDCAKALRMLGETDKSNEIFNVASYNNRTLKEYVDELKSCINDKSKIYFGKEKSLINLNVIPEKLIKVIGEYETVCFRDGVNKISNNKRYN